LVVAGDLPDDHRHADRRVALQFGELLRVVRRIVGRVDVEHDDGGVGRELGLVAALHAVAPGAMMRAQPARSAHNSIASPDLISRHPMTPPKSNRNDERYGWAWIMGSGLPFCSTTNANRLSRDPR
jgi:hypothetical protein